MNTAAPKQTKQNDVILWLAAAVVAGIGVVWLVMASPWSGTQVDRPATAIPHTAAAAANAAATRDATVKGAQASVTSSPTDQPLRMAKLAYEAGMLVEPEKYSAWTLYRQVLAQQPDNTEARQGLETIAGDLLKRANAALEQGRFDDAGKTVKRIQAALPDNVGARQLETMIGKLEAKAKVPAPVAQPVVAAAAKAPNEAKKAAPPVDPIKDAFSGFTSALAANQLLTPTDTSAKHFAGILMALAPDDPRSREARNQLFDKYLARANDSLTQKDTDSATTWLNEAGALGVDASRVTAARQKLTQQLIAIESARRMPISTYKIVKYRSPEYPRQALERGIAGWVDVTFTVGSDGRTSNITVTDSDHGTYFEQAAIAAVSDWRFQPHEFHGQPISQRTYTRISFNYSDSKR